METANIQILNKIEERLKNISYTNGYFSEPQKIKRAKLTPWQPGDLPAINYWSTGVTNTVENYRYETRILSIVIEYHSKTRDRAVIDLVDELATDVVIVLNRDVTAPLISDTPSYNLGGLISKFNFTGYDFIIGEGLSPFCGVFVNFQAEYKTAINDCFNIN